MKDELQDNSTTRTVNARNEPAVTGHPWRWLPSLYFAEGLPYILVTTVSVVMYKRLGLSNLDAALYTSWFYLPWVLKPFWSPVVDLLRTKRLWVIAMQLCIGGGLGGVALSLPLSDFLQYTILCFWLLAFASATHDIAADGFYMLALDKHQQTWFVGVRNTFYRLAMISGQGLLVVLAGYLEQDPRLEGNIPAAWSLTMLVAAGAFIALAAWHTVTLPRPAADRQIDDLPSTRLAGRLLATFVAFFDKPHIKSILAFLLLYRFAEAQLVRLAAPFLLDPTASGGLGLTTTSVGAVTGVTGVILLLAGGLCGGFAAARDGLRHWLFWMALAINLPNAVYIALAYLQPESLLAVHVAIGIEQFGYGFGFTGYALFMLYVADGPQRTSHFAICTGFMALGMMLPGMFSGWIQERLGYENFFLWVLLATVPSFIVARNIHVDPDFGKP